MISLATDTLASLSRLILEARFARSPVDVSEHGVDRRDDGHGVGDQPTAHHVGEALDVDERWGADVHAVRPRRAVADEIATELPPRALHREVHLALGHLETFGEELEVVDQGFHRLVDAGPRRWRHL